MCAPKTPEMETNSRRFGQIEGRTGDRTAAPGMKWLPRLLLWCAAAPLLTACDTDSSIVLPPEELTLIIEPAQPVLSAGSSLQLMAIVEDQDEERVDVTQDVVWVSDRPGIATVSATGRLTTLDDGQAMISAEVDVEGVALSAQVIVTVEPPASVEVTPSSATIVAIGGTVALVATAFDSDGNELSNLDFEWTSLDPSVATVDADGMVTGVAVGTVDIEATASCCNVSSTATVTVG